MSQGSECGSVCVVCDSRAQLPLTLGGGVTFALRSTHSHFFANCYTSHTLYLIHLVSHTFYNTMGKVKKWKKGRAERMRAENVRRRHEALSARRPPLKVTSTLALPTTTHDASPLPATPAPATPGPSSASSQDASSAEKTPSSHQKRMKMMQEIIPEPQGHFSKRYVISEEQLQAIVSRQKCPNATCKGSVQVKPTTLTLDASFTVECTSCGKIISDAPPRTVEDFS